MQVWHALLIILIVIIVALIVLYFFGKKAGTDRGIKTADIHAGNR